MASPRMLAWAISWFAVMEFDKLPGSARPKLPASAESNVCPTTGNEPSCDEPAMRGLDRFWMDSPMLLSIWPSVGAGPSLVVVDINSLRRACTRRVMAAIGQII